MIIQQRATEDLFCRDRQGKTAGGCHGGCWFSKGRTAPLGSSWDRPMNNDTNGHNKAITGVCRQCFVKEAGFLRGAQAGFVGQPRPTTKEGLRCPPPPCSRACVLQKAFFKSPKGPFQFSLHIRRRNQEKPGPVVPCTRSAPNICSLNISAPSFCGREERGPER